MRVALPPALVLAALVGSAPCARAEWRDPIEGASRILPATLEVGETMLTVHAAPRRVEPLQEGIGTGGKQAGDNDAGVSAPWHWSQPLIDRRPDPSQRIAPLDARLVEAIKRIEPIYDPTRLDGPFDSEPMRISAGTAEMRDIFGDRWRIASIDANVDTDVKTMAAAWTAGAAPRSCEAYRVRRAHEWREPALSAPTAADCRAILLHQARGFADAAPLPVAIAAPRLPIFTAPEPGSRMSSADFWAAHCARIASIHAHLHRKWNQPVRSPLRNAMN